MEFLIEKMTRPTLYSETSSFNVYVRTPRWMFWKEWKQVAVCSCSGHAEDWCDQYAHGTGTNLKPNEDLEQYVHRTNGVDWYL